MPNRHTYLNNLSTENDGFKKTRGNKNSNSDSDRTINRSRIIGLNQNLKEYNEGVFARNEDRTIKFNSYINLLWIHFYVPFNYDLRRKFYMRYGLLPQAFDAFNRSVLFEVIDENSFQNFQDQLKLLNRLNNDVSYNNKDFNLIALIANFEFVDDRVLIPSTEGVILNLINSSQQVAKTQQTCLEEYLLEEQINFEANHSSDLYFVHELSSLNLQEISDNFDIVQGITTSRPLTVRPGAFGNLRMSYGFTTKIPENLPIVGVIDTGVNNIEPYKNLILPTINITGQVDRDLSGHGTLVAGLCIFGSELPASIQNEYQAKCRILPIKSLHKSTDVINFPAMLRSIRLANEQNGVRIFNMSLTLAIVKDYNETFSHFAYELDKLTYELDILIIISVGNFDSLSLQDLLTTDHHQDHDYPSFFYHLNSTSPVHNCKSTNICVPSESLNNLSIGALAGNLQIDDKSDISPSANHPAYYSRKSHFDYNHDLHNKPFKKNQRNKYLNKPDLVFEGGDLHRDDSGMEVLRDPSDFYAKTSGTSLSAPLVASIVAEIVQEYPGLNMQSIKALLINSASYLKSKDLPEFEKSDSLLQKLVGFGKPEKTSGLRTNDNTISMILEKTIRYDQIVSIPLNLPEYLLTAGNKLIFKISLAYKFLPDRGNHLAYLPMHIGFNLIQNKPIENIAKEDSSYFKIKNSFSWSEDHFGLENSLFSNVQKKEYRLQPADIENLDGVLAIAIRCISKSNIDEQLLQHYKTEEHPFSIVITVTEEIKNETNYNLYNEMLECNDLTIIPQAEGEAGLEVEN